MDQASIFENVQQMIRMLQNISGWLEKANKHVQSKKTGMDVLLQTRLIVDQFPLVQQIQSSCDTAKFYGSRLSGKEPPVNPDTEKTCDEIQKRIKSTVAFLETIKPADIKDYESKKIEFSWNPGKHLQAKDYAIKFAIPNFYFHATTAYSILRTNGIDVGKVDFLGELPFKS